MTPETPPTLRRIELLCDDMDFDFIQRTFARKQAAHHRAFGETILPDGESNFAGAMVAELLRELDELRAITAGMGGAP